MKAISLQCAHLVNPIGIDVRFPRLSWTDIGGKKQMAFEIVSFINAHESWNSGVIDSSEMHCNYGGKLVSRDRVKWKIRLYDENGVPGEWNEATFEMGLLNKKDWVVPWVRGDYSPHKSEIRPVDYFQQHFSLSTLTEARLYISALGLYEAYLNGHRVGDFVFAPGCVDYRKRVYYQTYDVTPYLKAGENTLEIRLGNGWYRGSIGGPGYHYVFGRLTQFMAQLEVGGHNIILPKQWVFSSDGPIGFNDLKDGESVDFRKTPTFSHHARTTHLSLIPSASDNVFVKEHEHFLPRLLGINKANEKVYDFGQNIAGYIELTINAKNGQTLDIQLGEALKKDQTLAMEMIQEKAGTEKATPQQRIHLILKEGENHYKTTFAVFGFRYGTVKSTGSLDTLQMQSIAVYSDLRDVSSFSFGNPLINRLVENAKWSMKSNFLDIPTDCPTRERLGWLGDAQIFVVSATYLMDTLPFYRKWLRDVKDRQKRSGKLPVVAPYGGASYLRVMAGCCGWADAGVLVPYRLASLYSDDEFLLENYDLMRRHTLFEIRRTHRLGFLAKPILSRDHHYISNCGQAFGEWLEPNDVYQNQVWPDMICPHPEEATAYLSYICGLMGKAANKLGKAKDEALFSRYHKGCAKAYAHHFPPQKTKRQSKLVRPLAFNLYEGKEKNTAIRYLLDAIASRHNKVGTGFLSTPLLLPLLADLGYSDVAYQILENDERPGWLYEVKSGATTIWENWEGTASRNHYSAGSVIEFLFRDVCGVSIDGERHFLLKPLPGGHLDTASFSFDSPYGLIKSAWKKTSDGYSFDFDLPANTTAKLVLPDGHEENIPAGSHHYEITHEGTKKQ